MPARPDDDAGARPRHPSLHGTRWDAVVVGAGMSGLAAGLRLAQHDRRVLIVERHSLWGGLNSWYKLGGRRFDVGLHALTNYAPRGARGVPLTRVLRQLRISWDELELRPQRSSRIRFPGVELRFSNGLELLRAEIARAFPAERDGFERLVAAVGGYPDPAQAGAPFASARAELGRWIADPLLVEMLLLPVCWYGSAREHDVDWPLFRVLFKSIFEEGFARPEDGIRPLLQLLRRRFQGLGGVLRLRCGARQLVHEGGRVSGLVLDDGSEIQCARVLSSAGWVETLELCGRPAPAAEVGRLSFVESITVTDRPLAELGHDDTIVFFNEEERLVWARPQGAVDLRGGVLCAPDNYELARPPREGALRLTLLADHDLWSALPEERYRALKDEVWEAAHARLARWMPDLRPHAVFRDLFTPRTIRRFTGHAGGAVYGSPAKRADGRTPLEGLFLIGTDQGYLGVVGALLSGVAMANRHVLMELPASEVRA